MSNIGRKAGSNVYFIARSEASKANQRISSREGAAEEMNMDRGRLFRIENGLTVPYPEEIVLMSELYQKPELENYYCTHCCPLGHDMPMLDTNAISQIAINAMVAFRDVQSLGDSMVDIAASKDMNESTRDQLAEVLAVLDEICKVTAELKLWARKNLR